jgi:predicted metallo-beta-lactamase superfamily hydrolase
MTKPDKVYKHLFECMYPVLKEKEKEIFFKHPTEDIKCNQLGVIYYDEERYVCYDTRTGSVIKELEKWNKKAARTIATKNKVIWECYHQDNLEAGTQFLFTNGNPLDLTKDNLLAITRLEPEVRKSASETKKRFIKNSVDYLVHMESKFEKRGMDKPALYEALQIPNWLLGARKRWTGPVPRALKRKIRETFP